MVAEVESHIFKNISEICDEILADDCTKELQKKIKKIKAIAKIEILDI